MNIPTAPSGGPAAASVFKPRDRRAAARQPIWLKRDKFARHGDALLSAARAADPLERCLAVVRFALGTLADVLRPGGPDPDDTPVTALGQHHVTVRQLGPAARTRQGGGGAGAEGGRPSPGSVPPLPRVHVQELLAFDPAEGPKQLAHAGSGPPAATAHLRCTPVAKVKARRLGRDVSIKVKLEGGCEVVLRPAPPHPPPHSGPMLPGLAATAQQRQQAQHAADSAAATAGPAPEEERYRLELPALVLRGKLPTAAQPEFRGDLTVQCPATGLTACLTFKEDGAIKGSLELRQHPGQQAAWAAGGGAPPNGLVGSFAGSLLDTVRVVCPGLGLEGTVHSEQPPAPSRPGGLPPLAQIINLAAPGPQQLPRLWSALHDALLYHDPKQARGRACGVVTGGKAAEDLSRRLTAQLHGLFYEAAGAGPGGGGVAGDGGAAAGAAASTAGAGGAGGSEAATGAAGTAADSDSDSDFEAAAREEGDSPDDPRDVPPSYKAQHAAGRRVGWQLHYSVVTDAAPEPAPARASAGGAGAAAVVAAGGPAAATA
ncbi:hypothetical protein GPECTOR_32g410 [Gonium pectorale]|uniref:Uncharacterized protein n=1 Tax=Gonium pectorale TaxID=33097 RepID=A0A150GDA9_GONPE|nr:hypothetical protein GPECTOR_32g410 [Gonium pectorale]|eukprot:KXZ47798.1 hypothetical protein GPECTOR_32g410 [Gonium pectorale]